MFVYEEGLPWTEKHQAKQNRVWTFETKSGNNCEVE